MANQANSVKYVTNEGGFCYKILSPTPKVQPGFFTFMQDHEGNLEGRHSLRNTLDEGGLSRALPRADIEATLVRREKVLRAISGAAERFLGNNWRETMPLLLRELGEGTDVSRVYLFENRTTPAGEIRHYQLYEWCAPGVKAQINDPDLQNVKFSAVGMNRWSERLRNDSIIQGHVESMPDSERPTLDAQDIKSILVAPITVNGQWWGFMGFDECRAPRNWLAMDEETLRLSAGITAAAIAHESSNTALRESEQELAALFDAMRDPVFVMDRHGVYLKVFAHEESLLALPKSEIVGRSMHEIFEPDVAARFQAIVDEAVTNEKLVRVQYPMILRGEEKWFSASVTPLKEDGVLWIIRDITEAHLARQEVRQREELFRLLAENSTDCLATYHPDGTLLYVSPVVERIFGYTADELSGRKNFELAHPEDASILMGALQRAIGEPQTYQKVEVRLLHKKGHWVWTEITGHAFVNSRGNAEIHTVSRDITQQRANEEALRQAEEKYRSIFENAVQGIFQTTPAGNYLDANSSLARIYGFDSVEELRATFSDIAGQLYIEPTRRAEFVAVMEEQSEVSNFESQIRRKNGELIWISENARAVRDESGAITYYEGTVEDITATRDNKQRLLHDALHDQLTGLSNRALFMDRLEQSFARLIRHPDHLFAVLFLDFDRFKNINDSLGHLAGDELLKSIARRLQECLRPGDTVSRFGGDEFALLLEDVRDLSDATLVAERVQNAMRKPFQLGAQEVFSSASIGIALGHGNYTKAEDLLRDADMAMYRAKARGKARHEVFDAEMHTRAVALLQLETDLRWAIERHEFRLYYQPIVKVHDQSTVGFEALIRWQHPERGLVLPAEFIPIAEETGWIIPIGRWVLEEACAQLAKWQAEFDFPEPLSMSVNLSGKQFSQTDLIEVVETVIRASGIASNTLKLEITESAIMEDAQIVTQRLLELRKLGVRLGLDDFGTGYSSLSYLHRFPLDTLKIDRSFVARLLEDGENREIVRTIVTLGKNLGMDVVAEGVEEFQQVEDLRGLDCQHAQGYLFARPLPADEAIQALRNAKNNV